MSSSTDHEHVARATRRGLSWNLLGAIFTNALRLVIVAVLGRALDSTDFGIVAAAISINVFFYSIRDLGVGRAIVQQKTIDSGHLATAFAVSVYLGIGLCGLIMILAPAIGMLYRVEASVDVLRALSLLFALRGLSITSRMMCQRDMRFRMIAILDQIAFVAGSAVSVVAALSGAGPWALVAGYLTDETVATLLYLIKSRPPLSLRIQRDRLRDLMRFGASETVSQIAATLATYGDNYVVGHALGPRMLGYYTRAYDLIKFPSLVYDKIAGNVLFPMFSRLQEDRERLALGYRRAMFINALVLLPMSAALLIVAPEAIRLLMGPGWGESVLPFRILALTMLMRTSWKVGASIAGAAGWIRAVAIVNSMYMVLVIAGAIISIRWEIVGVAASTAIAITVTFVGISYLALRVTGLSLTGFVGAHVPGLLAAAATAACTWPLATVLRDHGTSPTLVFVAISGASALGSLGLVVLWLRRGRRDFGWLRAELSRVRGSRLKRS